MASGPALPSVDLTLDVHAAIAGSWEPAVPVAAAATALYVGADLLDDLADHELKPGLDGWSPEELTMAATILFGSLPYLALDGLREQGLPADRVNGLKGRIATGTLAMTAGQIEDLHQGADRALEVVQVGVALKSGAEFRIFAGLGASLATDDERTVAAYEEFGSALGIAAQLRSDCHDIWVSAPSADLLNGRRTLPVAYALSTLRGDDRAELVALLERDRLDPAAHSETAERLAAAGSLKYAAVAIQHWIAAGLAALDRAGPRPPAGDRLRACLADLSLLQHAG